MSKEIEFKNRDRFIQLGIAISALRKMRGLSQEQLAEKANVSRSHISSIEAPGIVRPFSLEVFFKAPPHNSRLGAQAACRAKIFRDIFQKCSPIRQGLPALFGSSHKKFFGTLHHLGLCGVALTLRMHWK